MLCGYFRVVLFVNDVVEDLRVRYFIDMLFINFEDFISNLVFVMICLSY